LKSTLPSKWQTGRGNLFNMRLPRRLRVCLSRRTRNVSRWRESFLRLLLCLCVAMVPPAGHAAPSCKRISGLAPVLRAPGIFVGDLHGTVQAPAFVKALMCHLLSSGHAAVLALEYPSDQQQLLDAFLHSHATDPELALLASPFWSRPTQDGRTSRAMLQLLEWIRGQIAAGARVRVLAFGRPPGGLSGTPGFNARDGAMATRLRQELAGLAPGEFPIIFTGNIHARKTKGLPFVNAPPSAANAEPLGYRLRDIPYLHLNIADDGGSEWACYGQCGLHHFGRPGPAMNVFSIRPSSDPAYDLEYFVGSISASPPAVARPATGK
jgi:hypothetical protein